MAATIKDVALRARVSIASVSRVLNGSSAVTEKTRESVLKAAQQLRYTPHHAARSLINGRSRTLGVFLPDLYGEYFSELLRGIDRAARAHNLHLLVSSAHDDAAEATVALQSMNGRVDGILVMTPHIDAQTLGRALPASLPTVLMNTPTDGVHAASLAIDNFGGAYAMTKHLLAMGYRRIAHITGPDSNYESGERLRGYNSALGPVLAACGMVLAGNFSEESGYQAGRLVAAANPRPDAVFAANAYNRKVTGGNLSFMDKVQVQPAKIGVSDLTTNGMMVRYSF